MAGLDLTRKRGERALPRLPHIAMFPPPMVPPACPAPTAVPTGPIPTPVATSTPVAPSPAGPPALDARSSKGWRYVLKFDLPSRMATMKNALGDSVSIIPSYRPPAVPTLADGTVTDRTLFQGVVWKNAANTVKVRSIRDTNKWLEPPPYSGVYTVEEINPDCNPGPGIRPGCTTWEFEIAFPSSGADPGPPIDVIADWATGYPTAAGTWEEVPPANIVGKDRARVNWGLIAYSGISNDACVNFNSTQSNVLITPIDPLGTDPALILSSMRLARDGGLEVGGGTPTRSALEKAQQHLIDTYARDPLYQCLRTYGVILVTDGESNICNNVSGGAGVANKEWGAGCPTDWDKYPPRISDDIWNLNLNVPCVGKPPRDPAFGPINPRSWVIGFGSEVGKCELNYTAYMGRTDANSPNADAGFDWLNDPRLCATPDGGGGCATRTYDSSRDYAYFADNTDTLVAAFKKITSSAATGDYATGAPLTGGSAGYGNIVFLSSTQFPSWEGHLYRFDTNKIRADGTRDPGYREWDAAAKLAARNASTRRIYTWNPSTLNLVEVNAASLGALQTIEPTLTAQIVDFVRGNDGAGVPRAKRLGPLINTVPSIVAGPVPYRQGTIGGDHATFASAYEDRRPMIWIGSNDGMLHAFDFETGEEILAIIPPQVLDRQAVLYDNFLRAGKAGTGQPDDFVNIFGVAGSLRFGDVYFPGVGFRTVGLVTLAEAGDLVAAIDITHPYPGDTTPDPDIPADPNYGTFPRAGDLSDAPVQVIWQKTGTNLPGLGATWSLPAIGARSSGSWSVLFGAGYDTASVFSSQKVPRVFQLNPVDGSPVGGSGYRDLANDTVRTPWVGNQAFADGVLFRIRSSVYAVDNLVERGLQADLNGRIWFLNPADISAAPLIGIDASAVSGQSQPIYYPPAAGGSGLPAETTGCNLYTFGSGTFYEESTRVNGPGTGTVGFIPSLFFASNEKSKFDQKIQDNKVLRIPINTILKPGSTTETLSPLSQMTGAPLLLIDQKGAIPNIAIFVIYDPTVGCNGASYAVTVRWLPDRCNAPLTVYEGTTAATDDASGVVVKTVFAGAGAASGLTAIGDQVFTGIAGLGAGGQADLYGINESATFGTGATFKPIWWKELK